MHKEIIFEHIEKCLYSRINFWPCCNPSIWLPGFAGRNIPAFFRVPGYFCQTKEDSRSSLIPTGKFKDSVSYLEIQGYGLHNFIGIFMIQSHKFKTRIFEDFPGSFKILHDCYYNADLIKKYLEQNPWDPDNCNYNVIHLILRFRYVPTKAYLKILLDGMKINEKDLHCKTGPWRINCESM